METKIEKRRSYERPRMTVVELQQRTQLMEVSGGLRQPNNYGNGGNPFGV